MTKSLQTVAAMACMKSLLMVFNFAFWLSGIIILGIGIWVEVEMYKYIEPSPEFSETAAYVLIGTGASIIIIGSLACCCTVKGQPVLLYIYGAFLAIIFVLELGAGVSIFAYRNKFAESFDANLNNSIAKYDKGSSELRHGIDTMQTSFKCCGSRSYADWSNLQPPVTVPESCCRNIPCDTSNLDDIRTQGCYNFVVEFLRSNIGLVAGTATGIAFFPLVGVVLSCCLAAVINKAKYEQMT